MFRLVFRLAFWEIEISCFCVGVCITRTIDGVGAGQWGIVELFTPNWLRPVVKATNNQDYDASSIETPSTVVPDRFFFSFFGSSLINSTKTILGSWHLSPCLNLLCLTQNAIAQLSHGSIGSGFQTLCINYVTGFDWKNLDAFLSDLVRHFILLPYRKDWKSSCEFFAVITRTFAATRKPGIPEMSTHKQILMCIRASMDQIK